MKKFLTSVVAITAALLTTPVVQARDQIRIVGSSTMYPFATVVAEKFGIDKRKENIKMMNILQLKWKLQKQI